MKKLVLVAAATAAFLTAVPLSLSTPAGAQVVIRGDRDFGRHNCRTVTISRWEHGARVTRTIRRCGGDRD